MFVLVYAYTRAHAHTRGNEVILDGAKTGVCNSTHSRGSFGAVVYKDGQVRFCTTLSDPITFICSDTLPILGSDHRSGALHSFGPHLPNTCGPSDRFEAGGHTRVLAFIPHYLPLLPVPSLLYMMIPFHYMLRQCWHRQVDGPVGRNNSIFHAKRYLDTP